MSDHETDFYQWTQTQSAAFRAKAWGTPDLENPAEEIESLGQNDRRAIRHQLARVLVHLLKWVYQPHQRGRYRESWRRSIYQARRAIADLIEESSSHQAYAAQQWRRAYWRALQQAAIETGLPPWRPFRSNAPEAWRSSRTRIFDQRHHPGDRENLS